MSNKPPAALLSLTPDDQSDSDEANNMPGEFKIWHNAQNDAPIPHTIGSSITKEKSSEPNASTATNKIEDNHNKKVDLL